MNLSLKNLFRSLKDKFKRQQQLKVDEVIAQSILTTKNQAQLAPDYSDQAHLFLQQDNYPKAIENLRKLIKISPNLADYHRDLGYALTHKHSYWYNPQLKETLINQGQIDEAIACYQKAVELGFDDYWTYIFLGDALTVRGRIEEARDSYQKALRCKIQATKPTFVEQNWDSSQISGPQFLIIGVAKCGTSSLYEYMIQHPQILSAAKKEIHFANHINHQYFQKLGIEPQYTKLVEPVFNISHGLDWYLGHFPPTPKNFVTGEATTGYFIQHDKAIALFRDLFPRCKLIVIFRNPVERVISHYYNNRQYGTEKRSLEEVVNKEIEMLQGVSNMEEIEKADSWQKRRGYLVISMYFYFLEKWMSVFPKEQFLILNSENFFSNPSTTLTKVFKFLGLPDYQLSEYRPHNQGSYLKDSSIEEQQLRTKLSQFFEPHNRKLEDYLGIKFNWN
jgi:tetratricopeptide (TPR) repeat protein